MSRRGCGPLQRGTKTDIHDRGASFGTCRSKFADEVRGCTSCDAGKAPETLAGSFGPAPKATAPATISAASAPRFPNRRAEPNLFRKSIKLLPLCAR